MAGCAARAPPGSEARLSLATFLLGASVLALPLLTRAGLQGRTGLALYVAGLNALLLLLYRPPRYQVRAAAGAGGAGARARAGPGARGLREGRGGGAGPPSPAEWVGNCSWCGSAAALGVERKRARELFRVMGGVETPLTCSQVRAEAPSVPAERAGLGAAHGPTRLSAWTWENPASELGSRGFPTAPNHKSNNN